jgi:hypothetical protein
VVIEEKQYYEHMQGIDPEYPGWGMPESGRGDGTKEK